MVYQPMLSFSSVGRTSTHIGPEMSDSDRYPTIREVLDGDAPFPANAYHNEDGMYESPEPGPTVRDGDMVQDAESGLWLPKPDQKRVTQMCFKHSGNIIQVTEPFDEVRAEIAECRELQRDAMFTGPVYDEPVCIPYEALADIQVISVEFRDLAELETAQRVKEHNLRMQEQMMAQQRAQSLGVLNQSRENKRRLKGLQ